MKNIKSVKIKHKRKKETIYEHYSQDMKSKECKNMTPTLMFCNCKRKLKKNCCKNLTYQKKLLYNRTFYKDYCGMLYMDFIDEFLKIYTQQNNFKHENIGMLFIYIFGSCNHLSCSII